MGELGLVGRRLSAQRDSLKRKRLARVSQSSTPLSRETAEAGASPWSHGKSPCPLQSAPPPPASLAVVPSVYRAKYSLKPDSGIDSSSIQHLPDPEPGTRSVVKFLHVSYMLSWQQHLPQDKRNVENMMCLCKGEGCTMYSTRQSPHIHIP